MSVARHFWDGSKHFCNLCCGMCVFRFAMKTQSIILAVGLACWPGLSPVTAAPFFAGNEYAGRWKEQRKERMEKRAEALGLTPGQREQIGAIYRENLAVTKPLMETLVAERRALRDAMTAQPVNEAAIRAQSEKVGSASSELNVQRARVMARVREVLTPEQAEKAKAMREKRAERVDRWRDRLGKSVGAE